MTIRTVITWALLLIGATSTGALAGPLAAAPPPDAELRIEVDISERTLYLRRGSELVESYEVAVGQEDHPTPRGDFSIQRIIWNPAWVPPPDAEWAEDETRKAPGDPDNPMKTAKIFFKQPDYYIHGTDATETLGTAASHGCLRMRPWAVAELAKRLMENAGEGRSQQWYDRVIENDVHRELSLDEAIPIDIHG